MGYGLFKFPRELIETLKNIGVEDEPFRPSEIGKYTKAELDEQDRQKRQRRNEKFKRFFGMEDTK